MIQDVSDGDVPRRRRVEYSHGQKVVPYRERRFVAWDGESTTASDGTACYVLFGNSDGWEISGPRVGSLDSLRLIVDYARTNPQVIHFGFAFGYDVNHILRDVPKARLNELKKTNVTFWAGYRLEYVPKKWFKIWDTVHEITVQIYDVFTYFMCSAVKAWGKYLKGDPRVATVSQGKDKRDKFAYVELETVIRPYFRLELQLYVDLVEKLRTLLHSAGIFPRGWHGPGAIANTILSARARHLIVRDIPEEVLEASQYAYFGGRFEQFKTGQYRGPVYSYDIRSAYPHAMRLLPDLANGEWVHSTGKPAQIQEYGLYRIDFDYDRSGAPYSGRMHVPMPFPFRDSKSQIHYPARVRGWYWGCEVKVARQWFRFTIHESFEFQAGSDCKPLGFLADMYRQRQLWVAQGNPAELALKLGYNSLYGKLAQRVGGTVEKGPPKWHQLELAGWATAKCRSMIYSAIMQNPMAIVAVETDGLFSTEPLNLPIGTELGMWDYDPFDGLIYVQSGVYWLSRWKRHRGHEWYKARIRGFGSGEVGIADALRSVSTLSPIVGNTHRFAGFNGYLFREQFLKWIDTKHVAAWGGAGKRAHLARLCGKCQGRNAQLHDLVIMKPWGGDSRPHFLPWKPDTGIMNEYAMDEDMLKWVGNEARELSPVNPGM